MEHHSAMSSFGLENSHVTAIVGGGGKSSLMAALGKEYHRRGETVIMTTTTHIRKLDQQQRIDEIAKMLSGTDVTAAAREQARLLLNIRPEQ